MIWLSFLQYISYDDNLNRYSTKLPWKTNRFPEKHFELCKNRLSILHRKLSKDENLLNDYNQLIVDQLNDCFIENCDISDTFFHLHYMLHHCVVKLFFLAILKQTVRIYVIHFMLMNILVGLIIQNQFEKLINTVTEKLFEAGSCMHEFKLNNPKLLNGVPITSVLCLPSNLDSDNLYLAQKFSLDENSNRFTERSLSKFISSIFNRSDIILPIKIRID